MLSRILPALRSQSEKVQFHFDASAPVTRQVEQVLDAIAAGAVAPDVGKQIGGPRTMKMVSKPTP